MRERIRQAVVRAPFLGRAVRLVSGIGGPWFAAWGGLFALQGILPAVLVYLSRDLVDALTRAIQRGDGAAIRAALVIVGSMAAASLASLAARSAGIWIQANLQERLRDRVVDLVHRKSAEVDLAFYEMPDFYDHLHRARHEAWSRPLELVHAMGSLLQNAVTLVTMTALLFRFGLAIPFLLVISTLPALGAVLWIRDRRHRLFLHTTESERRLWYFDDVLMSAGTAAELRLFELSDRIRSAYGHVREGIRRETLALALRQSGLDLAVGVFALAVMAGTVAWMLLRASRGEGTLGDLAMFYAAFQQGQGLMRALLENVGSIYESSLFIDNLFEFLGLEPRLRSPAVPAPAPQAAQSDIRLVGVTFEYPGHSSPAVENLTLTIEANRVTALVGRNGAGKSTLLKLLCRLYDPKSGRIEIGGVDLKKMDLLEVRRLFTVLFQEPAHYSATVAENIAFGAPPGRHVSSAEITAAARASGAEELIAGLPDELDSVLGRRFSAGTELSVGEWQRIGLARAFLRDSPIILLDEPTSAMDPWAEAEWFDRFRTLARGRTAILVTHRFTTAMRADVIHVVEGGRVVESGSHAELLARNGPYGAAWNRQMLGGP